MKALSRLLIFFGIVWCLMGGYYVSLRYLPNSLQFETYKHETVSVEKSQEKQSTPTYIKIEDLQISLPIVPAKVENDIWETTNTGASYLVSSPIPGNKGNSIIYGHNWANLFGNLTKAIPGQVVEIGYADGSKKRFIIEYTSVVAPVEASILESSNDKRITLYTCTGFFDSKRFVVVAMYDEKNLSFAEVARP